MLKQQAHIEQGMELEKSTRSRERCRSRWLNQEITELKVENKYQNIANKVNMNALRLKSMNGCRRKNVCFRMSEAHSLLNAIQLALL
jgi:hypothetical protein